MILLYYQLAQFGSPNESQKLRVVSMANETAVNDKAETMPGGGSLFIF